MKYISVFLFIFFASCSKHSDLELIKKKKVFVFSTPEKQGMDTTILNNLYQNTQALGFVDGLLIVKNGFIVGEKYYNGFDKDRPHNVKSVSKSILSAIAGIAINNGEINLYDKMIDYFPQYKTPSLDPRKLNITIQHLLTMRMGTLADIDNNNSVYSEYYNSPNWITKIIETPLAYNPGEKMSYNTFQTHLLSVIISKATQTDIRSYATSQLFIPLRIDVDDWEKDPQGNYFGGNSMFFTPREMYLFGKAYKNKGKLFGKQLIPESWVNLSLTASTNFNNYQFGAFKKYNYAYLWWLGEINGKKMFMAYGYGGQYIIVFPKLDLIIVTTTNNKVIPRDASIQEQKVFNLVAQYILPSIY